MQNNNNLVLEYKCLDHGFVRLVDWMGDDSSIVQAARVSYGKGTKSVSEDTALIRYLMRHLHTSPFEMVEFKFHVKLPIFVARQWIRHRTANVNEYSGRYSEMPDEFYLPEPEQLRLQSTLNKQGRGEASIDNSSDVIARMKLTQEKLFQEYSELLSTGLAREIARINLPLSNYTEWYWKIDLHNLFHFLRLRLDSHAQYEIRVYAEAISKIIKQIVPIAYQAFEDYTLEAIRFSRNELNALKLLITKDLPSDERLSELGLSKREIQEFKEKINKI
ncbi:MAG: FAD-dependent thymidylate synthase [Bacteroidota bacterium]